MKLSCGCTNGIPVRLTAGKQAEWLVCPQHDDPEFVAHVRRLLKAEWFYRFTPNRKGRPQVRPL